jgi:pyruvate/2-oxoglutarate dehydrogenase complex dihydrolipoamide dehydrogenase (E3) component
VRAVVGIAGSLFEPQLLGGECSDCACIPSNTLLQVGEAVLGARAAAASAEVDVEAAVEWCDFTVSEYSDAGQERWLADNGIDLPRGNGRLARTGVVEVDERLRHTAQHVVVPFGVDPFLPGSRGRRERDGVWTNREATGTKPSAPPADLGGGPVSVEMAQAARPLGGEVAPVQLAITSCPRRRCFATREAGV